jgi:hypothetical protein
MNGGLTVIVSNYALVWDVWCNPLGSRDVELELMNNPKKPIQPF